MNDTKQPGNLVAFSGTASSAHRPLSPVCCDVLSPLFVGSLNKVAASDVNVLITGETGTGKEVVARYVHERSGRSGPFIAVNCGALSEQLVEAELFGHEAGAFTDAQHARAGWFEAANGGTLLLDEVGDLPPGLQVKLLRVLQERQVVRIGARRPIAVDVRIIAATNVDLAGAVVARRFRRDLYYRINVAPVFLAPLRDRPQDILPLAKHFADHYAGKLGIGLVEITRDTERVLLSHYWPGNVRELENTLQMGLIHSRDGILAPHDIRFAAPTGSAGVAHNHLDEITLCVRRLLSSDTQRIWDAVEKILLVESFDYCGQNQVRTAKRLGISRSTVRTLMKNFGLLENDDETDAEDSYTPLSVRDTSSRMAADSSLEDHVSAGFERTDGDR